MDTIKKFYIRIKKMNSRERVKKAIRFKKPDRVPISHAVLPAALLKYGEQLSEILAEYREDFGWDYMNDLQIDQFKTRQKYGRNRDQFGTVWETKVLGISGIPVDVPIKELDDLKKYEWPKTPNAGPPAGRLYSGHMEGFDERWYARGGWITYFEQLQQLRGMTDFMMDIAFASKEFFCLLDEMLAFNLNWLTRWTSMEYDGIHFADDWGAQNHLLIRPETWRRIFKPKYAEMFNKVHEAGMDVWYHTDGHINEIFEDFLELGVDVINCQETVIDRDWIANNIRGKIAFRTDIDRQFTLPFGSPSEVKEEVQRSFEACGTSEGGLIACGEIGPDVPIENIRALYEAFREYGNYKSSN
jgi:uroporphyrinogen decarboxylase